jgi:hypothetical protein
MRLKYLLCSFILLSGCSFLSPFSGPTPFHIKAVIEGEIKGHKIRCEKNIDIADGRWGVMCSIGNDMDVKYRVRPMSDELTQIEFVVGKSKEGREKLIATPSVLVKRSQSARAVASTHNANIIVMAERTR